MTTFTATNTMTIFPLTSENRSDVIRQLGNAGANVALRIPEDNEANPLGPSAFAPDDAGQLLEQAFAYEGSEPKTFRIPLGYLNVHIANAPTSKGERHAELCVDHDSQIRHLNAYSACPTATPMPTTFAYKEKAGARITATTTDAVFETCFRLVRGPSRAKMLAFLAAQDLVGLERSAVINETVYAVRLPPVEVVIDDSARRPWTLRRLRLVYDAIMKHLQALDANFLVIKNGYAPDEAANGGHERGARRVNEFAYFFRPKVVDDGKGNRVVYGEQTSADGHVLAVNVFDHEAMRPFTIRDAPIERVYGIIEAFAASRGLRLQRSMFPSGDHGRDQSIAARSRSRNLK